MPKIKKSADLSARNYVPIIGLKIDSSPREEVLNRAWVWASGKGSPSELRLKPDIIGLNQETPAKLIVTPNPEIATLATQDSKLAEILNEADLSLPDGHGIVWAARVLGYGNSLKEVVPGRWVMEELVHRTQVSGLRTYLLGGEKGIADKARAQLVLKYNLKTDQIKSSAGPWLDTRGFPIDKEEEKREEEVIRELNDFQPSLLFVAFGAPKQEKWLARNLPKLQVKVVMTVGGALDYVSGKFPPPPKFIEGLGLEWFWRLVTQPRRAGRIFTAMVVFPLKVLQYKLFGRV